MSFTIYETDVIMCTGENLLTYDLSSDVMTSIALPQLTIENRQKHHNNLDCEAYHGITTVFTSINGEYFCACTNRKQLCLYERSTRSLLSNRTLARAASKAAFTPNNDVIVADKSGDVYLFETKNPCESGKLILGHLSMLLDCFVTKDNKYIITADRDEKIRISCFPNAYNIVSYCLGHTKFVTSVAQLPLNHDILVSSGGDGKLKIWDFAKGKELESYDFGNEIPAEELGPLNESLKCFELTEAVETLPVKHLWIDILDDTNSIIIVAFHASKRILLYTINKTFRLQFSNSLFLDEEPLECFLRNKELWILDDNGLKLYRIEGTNINADTERNKSLMELNKRWSSLRKNANKQSLFPILYKRKFENVQEYLDRKKSRLRS